MNNHGGTVTEFVLVLPWFLGCLLVLIAVAVGVTEGQLMHYAAFKGARSASVYEDQGVKMEINEIVPEINIEGLEKGELFLSRKFYQFKNGLTAYAPVNFSLDGVSVNLKEQAKQDDPFHMPAMDNFIGYCGEEGSFGLCAR